MAELYLGLDFLTSDPIEPIEKRYWTIIELSEILQREKHTLYNMIRIAEIGKLRPDGYHLNKKEVAYLRKMNDLVMSGETLKGAYQKLKRP